MAAAGSNSQKGDASASASSDEHPLISLHANNKNSSAAATAAVKLETKTNTTESDNKDNVVRIMSSRNNHSSPASSSSSSSWKLSSLFSIKTAILMLILPSVLVLVYMISSLEATHEIIMDNKIATSAIILHHCHSFMMTFVNAVSKLVLSIKDTVLHITTISLSSSTLLSSTTNSHRKNEVIAIAIENLQTRLHKGQLLLSAYNDQSGSDMVCNGVANSVVQMANERKWKRINDDAGSANGEYDDNIENDKSTSSSSLSSTSLPLSYSSLISLQLSQEESSLLSKSLSCVAEANLALYSSSSSSTMKKQQHLNIAKSFLDNAMMIDPTDPLIRANVGLVYLLLGTTASSSPPPSAATSGFDDDDHDESPVQFVLQSIQNLNVAIGILNNNIKEYESSSSSTSEVVYMAALYNLGIAHLALDGFDDDSSDHYMEWINSLATADQEETGVPSTTSSILESSALLLVNKGTSLLHSDKKVDDAIVGLTSFIDEFCMSGDDVVNEVTKPIKAKQKREDELCSIVRHNLAIAKGDGGASNSEDKIDISTILVDDAVEESSVELNTNVSAKTDYIIEDNTQGVQHSSTSDESNATDSADNQEEEVQQREEEEDIYVVDAPTKSKVNHEMQGALVALEKAAETTQRSRLLLALAKARVYAGDYAGAVDAALKAVSTASTNEEIDTSTSYLDSLMNQIADEESDAAQTDMKSAKDHAQARLGEEDLSVTELKLKLELEKLKYKVLEQEMRLAQQQQYQAWNHHLQRDINLERVKSIDYMQNDDHDHFYDQARPVKAIEEVVEMENDALSEEVQDSDSAKENTTDDFSPVDAEINTKEEDPSNKEQQEQVKAPAESTVSSKETEIDPDVKDFDEEDPVLGVGERSELNVVDVDEDAPAVAEETSLVQQEQRVVPSLFIPVQEQPTDLTAHAKSYMKMADAYLDKGQYALASKQFLKVIKKVSDHLPAHLGYATAIERDGKNKQIIAAALAYGNATRVAITQAPPIDPLVQAGGGGIAENILRRAVKLAKAAPAQRLETLQILSTHAHTAALAADIYYEIGLEIASSSDGTVESRASAKEAFTIANEFVLTRNDDKSRFHIGSTIELGRLALDGDNDAKKATEILNQINMDMEDNDHVKLLVLVGRAHMALGEIEVAISQLTRALSLPDSPDTQDAHYELAIALTKNKADKHEIDIHFEKALDFGMDPTDEIIEALGERNMSVMKALNRQYYRSFNNQAESGRSEGGILSGGGVGSQSSSLFASQQASQDDSTQSDPLSLLEQGASAYDAGSPMGGEVESSESHLSHLSNRKAK